MSTKELPNKPSELLNLALNDLELCEKDSKYVINMGTWHLPEEEDCLVCLAGAVMAKSLDCDIDAEISPSEMKLLASDQAKLNALDRVIKGDVGGFLGGCGVDRLRASQYAYISVIFYDDNPVLFKETLRDLAGELKEDGL